MDHLSRLVLDGGEQCRQFLVAMVLAFSTRFADGVKTLQSVCGALHALRAETQNVRVDHRRRYVAMAQELLHRPDVLAALEEMGGKGVTERVTGNALVEAGGVAAAGSRAA